MGIPPTLNFPKLRPCIAVKRGISFWANLVKDFQIDPEWSENGKKNIEPARVGAAVLPFFSIVCPLISVLMSLIITLHLFLSSNTTFWKLLNRETTSLDKFKQFICWYFGPPFFCRQSDFSVRRPLFSSLRERQNIWLLKIEIVNFCVFLQKSYPQLTWNRNLGRVSS